MLHGTLTKRVLQSEYGFTRREAVKFHKASGSEAREKSKIHEALRDMRNEHAAGRRLAAEQAQGAGKSKKR